MALIDNSFASAPVPEDAPVMIAWRAYKETPQYANTARWASNPDHIQGSLWAAFLEGFQAAGKVEA